MAYVISEIGQFETYTPASPLYGLPPEAIYCRRVADGADWYGLTHNGAQLVPAGVVLATASKTDDPDIFTVQAVVWDQSLLFPGKLLLLKIEGVSPDIEKPHKLFEQQLYQRATATISPPPPPVLHQLSKKVLWDRMSDDEAERFDADLQEAPSKLRRTFEAATILDDRDPMWPDLRNALLVRVTPARADALLQRTD